MNPSSVSGDAAQPAPQLPLPVASPPPQPPAPPPEPLSDIAAAEAAVARLPPFERNKFIAKRVAEALPPGKLSLPIGGRKKQAILLVPANVDSPMDQKCLVVKRVGDELQVPQQPSAATEPSPESMSGQESRVVMEKFKFTSRVSNAKMKFFISFSLMVLRPTGSNAFTLYEYLVGEIKLTLNPNNCRFRLGEIVGIQW